MRPESTMGGTLPFQAAKSASNSADHELAGQELRL